MLFRTHKPSAPLSDFVDNLWHYEGLTTPHRLERVLPDGSVELIVNLRDESRHIFDPQSLRPLQTYRHSWISGPHSRFIVIDTAPDSSMIGAHFKPGGVSPVLGVPANVLTNEVVGLSECLNRRAETLRTQLLEAVGSTAKFHVLETWLLQSWRRHGQRHPAVTFALNRFTRSPDQVTVCEVATEVGLSHRHFVRSFSEQVGVSPKVFCRIQRFQKVLKALPRSRGVLWADVAVSGGYYDQSHFIHDFREFCGMTPARLVESTLEYSNFVPICG